MIICSPPPLIAVFAFIYVVQVFVGIVMLYEGDCFKTKKECILYFIPMYPFVKNIVEKYKKLD